MQDWIEVFRQRLVVAGSVDALGELLRRRAAAAPLWAVAINAEKLIAMRSNPRLLSLYGSADVWYADGIFSVLVARMLGKRGARVPGIELGAWLLRDAATRHSAVALVGGERGVAERVAAGELLGGAEVRVTCDGFRSPAELERAVEGALAKGPLDVIAVAMGSPRQEEVLARVRRNASRGILIGLGGSFDVFTGLKKRAPRWLRELGLEWMYRLVTEPTRFRRYFGLLRFPLVLADVCASGSRGA